MKKGLILSGYACKSWIWQEIQPSIEDKFDVKVIDWPIEIISSFHTLDDFANWGRENVIELEGTYDFIIGHSMGGLVALVMAAMKNVRVKKVVLVESFITSPGLFFQNILMENAPASLVEKVTNMMQHEAKYYSELLRYNLRDLDMSELVTNLNCEITAIYGDRGNSDHEKVLKELNWSEKLQSKIKCHVIKNSCHFPMLENSNELKEQLIIEVNNK